LLQKIAKIGLIALHKKPNFELVELVELVELI